jgi:glycolate oxidase
MKPETPLDIWKEKLPSLLTELYQVVYRLGGTISGEHGIGSKRASYLPLVMNPDLISLEERVKQAFDPLNILNPGKIFPFRRNGYK